MLRLITFLFDLRDKEKFQFRFLNLVGVFIFFDIEFGILFHWTIALFMKQFCKKKSAEETERCFDQSIIEVFWQKGPLRQGKEQFQCQSWVDIISNF